MSALVTIVLPVFALMALGYLFARQGLFREGTGKGLSDFVFTMAVPALLFRTVEQTPIRLDISVLIWISFMGALGLTWALATLATASLLRRPPPDAAAIAMTACFGNVVLLGIPLATNAWGAAAAVPLATILAVHTPTLWTLGSVHMALATNARGASLAATLRAVAIDLAKNPIILAVIAGTLWRWTGIGLHPTIDRILTLLGEASTPTALVAVGIGLVGVKIHGQAPTLAAVIALKMLVMPAIAAVLALVVLPLDPVSAGVVVLLAAMPSGANAYLFASRHDRVVNSTSGAVALGTLLSIATVTVIVTVLVPPR